VVPRWEAATPHRETSGQPYFPFFFFAAFFFAAMDEITPSPVVTCAPDEHAYLPFFLPAFFAAFFFAAIVRLTSFRS
jgi:hypothetical protein